MPMPIKNLLKHKYKIFAFIYTLAVAYISLSPLDQYNLPNINMGDKIVHVLLYLFLSLLWLLAYPLLIKIKWKYILTIIAWGILIEFLQAFFITGRSGDFFDALANSIGSLMGLWIYTYFFLTHTSSK
jgi:VanZ family protein